MTEILLYTVTGIAVGEALIIAAFLILRHHAPAGRRTGRGAHHQNTTRRTP